MARVRDVVALREAKRHSPDGLCGGNAPSAPHRPATAVHNLPNDSPTVVWDGSASTIGGVEVVAWNGDASFVHVDIHVEDNFDTAPPAAPSRPCSAAANLNTPLCPLTSVPINLAGSPRAERRKSCPDASSFAPKTPEIKQNNAGQRKRFHRRSVCAMVDSVPAAGVAVTQPPVAARKPPMAPPSKAATKPETFVPPPRLPPSSSTNSCITTSQVLCGQSRIALHPDDHKLLQAISPASPISISSGDDSACDSGDDSSDEEHLGPPALAATRSFVPPEPLQSSRQGGKDVLSPFSKCVKMLRDTNSRALDVESRTLFAEAISQLTLDTREQDEHGDTLMHIAARQGDEWAARSQRAMHHADG